MSLLPSPQLQPGHVIRLDTGVLRARGDCQTNAQVTADEDRAVTGVHDFLVVAMDARTAQVIALPLFPRSAPGSAPLDDALRTGDAAWLAAPVFYSRWQHWRIPIEAVLAAAVAAEEAAGDSVAPRAYATGKADVLQALANWASRNRCAYRPA